MVAHRCTDRTEDLARRLLCATPALVLADESPTVATARAAGATAALAQFPAPPSRSWLLSTDADSIVPPTWITDIRRHILWGAAAVVGLVHVHDWPHASPAARAACQDIVATGIAGQHRHNHVYGANLAVRADAYLDVGGWPNQIPGEDSALVEALRARNWPVSTATDVWTYTSGRRTPRAVGGLGSLLERLVVETHTPAPSTLVSSHL